ncbi:hypothetical protein D9M72_534770 [compost metagenome]
MKLEEGLVVEPEVLRWMSVIHGSLLLSALILAIIERLSQQTRMPHPPREP